jgi:hypothetical protein
MATLDYPTSRFGFPVLRPWAGLTCGDGKRVLEHLQACEMPRLYYPTLYRLG